MHLHTVVYHYCKAESKIAGANLLIAPVTLPRLRLWSSSLPFPAPVRFCLFLRLLFVPRQLSPDCDLGVSSSGPQPQPRETLNPAAGYSSAPTTIYPNPNPLHTLTLTHHHPSLSSTTKHTDPSTLLHSSPPTTSKLPGILLAFLIPPGPWPRKRTCCPRAGMI
jgi:hypothetical protein